MNNITKIKNPITNFKNIVKFVLPLTLVLTSIVVFASENDTTSSVKIAQQENVISSSTDTQERASKHQGYRMQHQKQCEIKANAAESIMRMYQSGTTVSELLQRTDRNASLINENVREVVVLMYKELVYRAASTPKYSTYSYQNNAIVEFSNKIMMGCLNKQGGL